MFYGSYLSFRACVFYAFSLNLRKSHFHINSNVLLTEACDVL